MNKSKKHVRRLRNADNAALLERCNAVRDIRIGEVGTLIGFFQYSGVDGEDTDRYINNAKEAIVEFSTRCDLEEDGDRFVLNVLNEYYMMLKNAEKNILDALERKTENQDREGGEQ